MRSLKPLARATGFSLAIFLGAGPSARADVFDGVSLRVLNQSAPPGGSVQLVVTITEPKPIIIGMGALLFGGLTVQGVLLPGAPDAAAAAVKTSGGLAVRAISPSGGLGLSLAVPLLVATLAVPPGMAPGASVPLLLDPSASMWFGPLGLYPQQIRQGVFEAKGAVAISNVVPGGGALSAGAAVSLIGIGFQPGALVEIDAVPIAAANFIDTTRIDVIIGANAQLDGRRVVVKNPDGSKAAYFSYLRAAALGESARPLLARTDAVYPLAPISGAFFTAPALGQQEFFALALQNPSSANSAAKVEIWSGQALVASTQLLLPPRTEMLREISELFSGVAAPPGSALRVSASVPLQMLALRGDDAAGTVSPLLPDLAFP